MSEKDLIPFSQRTEEEQKKIRSMGGSVRSPRKSMAAKLRWMREKGFKTSDDVWFYNMMKDHEFSEGEILRALQVLADDPEQSGFYNKLLMDWHKIRHGSKEKNQTNVLVQNQLNLSVEDKFKSLLTDEKENVISV